MTSDVISSASPGVTNSGATTSVSTGRNENILPTVSSNTSDNALFSLLTTLSSSGPLSVTVPHITDYLNKMTVNNRLLTERIHEVKSKLAVRETEINFINEQLSNLIKKTEADEQIKSNLQEQVNKLTLKTQKQCADNQLQLHDMKKNNENLKESLLLSERKCREFSDQTKKKDHTLIEYEGLLRNESEKVKFLQESLNYYCGENTKLKNKMKTISEDTSSKSDKEIDTDKDIKALRDSIENLKTLVSKEITQLRKETRREITDKIVYTPATLNNQVLQPQLNTLKYHSNNPQTKECSPDEKGKTTPLSNMNTETAGDDMKEDEGEQIHLFSSSMMRDVDEEEFNSKLDKGAAHIHLYRGKRSPEIRKRVQDHLKNNKTDSVVILGGGNDLSSSAPPETIAQTLINIGVDCSKANVPTEKIRISSVLPRDDALLQMKRKQVNDILQRKCLEHNFTFIENKNIVLSRHIRSDGVHLNKSGTSRLVQNFLDVLNGKCLLIEDVSMNELGANVN